MKSKMFLLLTICLFAPGCDAPTSPLLRSPEVEARRTVDSGLARAESSPSISYAATMVQVFRGRMPHLPIIFPIIGGLCFVGSLICYILVLIRMFERGLLGLGITCIVLTFCCAIGGLVAFVYGWMNATEWRIKNVMVVWTCIVVVHLVLFGSFISMHGFHMPVVPGW